MQGEGYYYTRMSQDQHSDPIATNAEMQSVAEKAFRKANAEYKNADPDKPVKLFGIEMDPMTARFAKMGYNFAADMGSEFIAPRTYDVTTRLLSSARANRSTTVKTAAMATTAMNVALKSGGYLLEMFDNAKDARKAKGELARSLGNELDDIKGKHSIGALNSTSLEQNSLIYAHVKRMNKRYSVIFKNGMVDLLLNAGPNLLLNAQQARGMWAGEHPNHISNELSGKSKDVVRFLASGGTAEFTEVLKKNNTRRLDKVEKSYSGLDMVLTLAEQVEHNPKQRSFQVPGKRGEAYGLEEYIMRVVIHHSKELSDLNPDYTEVREGLRDELAAAVKPIAESIRNGDISAMELIHLVGEGKIVQRHGRVIASVEEIKDAIHQGDASHAANYFHESAEQHYAKASYNREELKKALSGLEGEQRRVFASLFSDEVLADAGMKKAEIKEMHEQSANDNGQRFAEVVVGTESQGEAALKEAGSSHKEIEVLNQAGSKIMKEGLKIVPSLRSSTTHAGIEHSIANALVAKQKNDKDYLRSILDRGQDLLSRNDNEANDNPRPSHRERLHHERGGHDFGAESYR